MRFGPPSVFGFLSAARALSLGTLDFGLGRHAAIWRNEHDRITYERPGGHTFSLYLQGGGGTRRIDGRPLSGWPGALCVMPHGRSSEWEIEAPFTFVHLYVPDEQLRRAFADTFDRDARSLDLAEMTFAAAPGPASALRGMAEAVLAGDPLEAEAAADAAVALILADPLLGGVHRIVVRGGVAPHVGRRIADFVEAHLHEPIRLADLAGVAGLSPFHLQRAFRASRGVSPHAFVTHRRVVRARSLLRGRSPIADIALACGFSSQSHFTRAFRAATGLTPAAYRAHVRPRDVENRGEDLAGATIGSRPGHHPPP